MSGTRERLSVFFEFDDDGVAVLERDREVAFAQRDRVVSEYLRTPAMQRRNTFVLMRGETFDVIGIRDQPGRDTNLFGLEAQERLEQIHRSR